MFYIVDRKHNLRLQRGSKIFMIYFFLELFFYFVWISVFSVCMSVSRVSDPRVPDSFELPWEFLELNLVPLKDQSVLLISESSLKHLVIYFVKEIYHAETKSHRNWKWQVACPHDFSQFLHLYVQLFNWYFCGIPNCACRCFSASWLNLKFLSSS